eukprot:1190889-Prorocentrum_minimum.AAC.5
MVVGSSTVSGGGTSAAPRPPFESPAPGSATRSALSPLRSTFIIVSASMCVASSDESRKLRILLAKNIRKQSKERHKGCSTAKFCLSTYLASIPACSHSVPPPPPLSPLPARPPSPTPEAPAPPPVPASRREAAEAGLCGGLRSRPPPALSSPPLVVEATGVTTVTANASTSQISVLTNSPVTPTKQIIKTTYSTQARVCRVTNLLRRGEHLLALARPAPRPTRPRLIHAGRTGPAGGSPGNGQEGVGGGVGEDVICRYGEAVGGGGGVPVEGKYWSSVDARQPQNPTKREEYQTHLQGVLYIR